MLRSVKTTVGLMLFASTSTVAVAQTGNPIVVSNFIPIEFAVSNVAGKDTVQYVSYVHGLALRDVTFTDSAAVKALVLRQAEELWAKAGKEWLAADQDMKATAEQREERRKASQKVYVELLNKFLPEFRPLVPAAQQATFDQNLKTLQAVGYVIMAVSQYGNPPRVDTLPSYLVYCGSNNARACGR